MLAGVESLPGVGVSLLRSLLLPLEFWLAKCEWNISVSYHMLNLSLHCDTEKCYEVHHENWPEYRDVEQLKERAEECNGRGLGGRVPELELWQTADERSELFILTCWKTWAVFFRLVLRHSGVNLGREEGQQQVQVVDCERICNYIPSLG